MANKIPARVTLRAYEKWVPGLNGCRLSTYSVQSRGYAQIGWLGDDDRRMHGTTAHRAAWMHIHGEPPAELEVDHRPECDRRCVNVDHLRLLTRSGNARRNRRDFPLDQQCVRGHPAGSRRSVRKGNRTIQRCRLCHLEQSRESKARRRAAVT